MDVLHLVFVLVTAVFSAIDLLLSVLVRKKSGLINKRLANVLLGISLIGITCVFAALIHTQEGYTALTSLHFASISITTLYLLVLVLTVTGADMSGRVGFLLNVSFVWTLLECVLFIINSFTGIAVSFVPNVGHTNSYTQIIRFPFYLHLAFVFLMTSFSLYHLVRRFISVPSGYKTPYVLGISGMLLVLLFSMACVFIPSQTGFMLYDFTACSYLLTALLVYISYSRYRNVSLPNRFRNDAFESIGQGVLLYDFEGHRLLLNHRAEKLLSDETLEKSAFLGTLCETLGIGEAPNGTSFRVSRDLVRDPNAHRAVNIFSRALTDKNGKYSGQLLILTDVSTDTDPLTGFVNWDSYRQHTLLNGENLPQGPVMIGALEITDLRGINENKGREAGDRSISELATIMRREFPADVTFVRGPETVLLAFCDGDNMSDDDIHTRLQACKAACSHPCVAAHALAENGSHLSHSIHDCFQTLTNKRMLEAVSSNNSSLSSLIRALHECDSDTESHVQRTRLTGMALADRLKLSDADKSSLNLLCLLHDIGKISIPLDILNKPGKLTESEWQIIRSHAEKGYQITSSSHEIEPIAELVLHHHERWDGTGYPGGLSGESIPLLSRIISVVDAYDAMIHDRAYRNAMAPEEAQEELRRCAGTQFDPTVVSTFLELLQEDPARFAPATKQSGAFRAPGPVIRTEETLSNSEAPVNTFHMVYTRYLIDDQLNIVDIDDNFEALTGYSLSDVVELTLSQRDLLPTEDLNAYLNIVSEDLKQKSMAYLEHRLRKKNGEIIQVFCFGRAYFDSAVRAGRSEIIVADARNTAAARLMEKSAQNREQNRLEHWKNTYRRDSLTGLLTHTAFQNDVESVLLSGHNRILFIMLDLDNFKMYNDTYGHQTGDNLLVQLSQAFEASLRKDDLAGRMGGDEFAAIMVFDEVMPDEAITERAIQMFDKIHMSLKLKGIDVKCSMGAAISGPGDTFRDLYSKADEALYRSKEGGRNRLTVYDVP